MLNQEILHTFVNQTWDEKVMPTLCQFVEIPNKSPMFDDNWKQNGYMDQAVKLFVDWCYRNAPEGMQLELLENGNRTPLIFIEIPAFQDNQSDKTILIYGHLDKQPEMEGWDDDLGPWKAVIKDNKLFGRGGADDGYAIFSALTAINALQQQNIAHPRCVIIIEASEESGSPDLPYYIDCLNEQIGTPELVICLDSTCGNYEQLWSTTSLRGVIGGTLSVQILQQGLHSGGYSGIAASSFRIIRQLLSRLEDEQTGEILLPELHAEIPETRIEQARAAATILGDSIFTEMPFTPNANPISMDGTELLLNRSWRPTICVTGAEGLPALKNAGNVLLPKTSLKLSIRIPPTIEPFRANAAVKECLESHPPYGAEVCYQAEEHGPGWNAPELAPWLIKACDNASNAVFRKPCAYFGEGGSIPFMGMLGEKFPQAQFLITGVLGPRSNAHGPNEFLHLAMVKKLTESIAMVLRVV